MLSLIAGDRLLREIVCFFSHDRSEPFREDIMGKEVGVVARSLESSEDEVI